MAKNVTYQSQKDTFPKDSIVILQGSDKREIHFLHKGVIELKRSGKDISGLQSTDIIKQSKRIGAIEAPSIFGVQNLINSNPHNSSFIALTDCVITKYVIPSNDFINFFKYNPPISLNILITMQEQANKNLINLKKFVDFSGIIQKIQDNLKLLFLHANDTKEDPLYQKFINNGGVFPPVIEPSFLTANNATILSRTYGDPSYDPVNKFDGKKIDFFKHLLKTKSAAFINLIANEIKIFLYMFENLSSIITELNIETEKLASKVEKELNYFFRDGSSSFNLITSRLGVINNSKTIGPTIPSAIVKICRNIEHINKQLGGTEFIEVFPKYDLLNDSAKQTKKDVKTKSSGKFKQLYKDSMKKILAFSTLNEDTKTKIAKNLAEMQAIDPNQGMSKENRALVKHLQDDYYQLYQNLFMKAIKFPTEVPPEVKLFFYFSFIDEKIITEKQLEFIHDSINYFKNQSTEYPIITLYDYLLKVYNSEEEPSLSERGEFRKLIKKPFSKNEKPISDTPDGRVEFEIDNMVSTSMRITSDNVRSFIPYLSEKSFKGALSQIFVNPKKLDAYIRKIADIDYTLFYREMTWKIPGKSELIKKEIKPYLILMPSAGSRIQMWQELVYNIRTTRARYLIPVIFNSDLNKELVQSCGHFRWNLNKALVSNWMDPVDGGLTGAYYDYELSYKKMTDLSIEAKEKIKKQISTIKIDRNRFAHDYYEWVIYESQGVPKLNKVLRKIFYRYVPFKSEIRENISKLPVYAELDRKFNIIRNRDYKKLEARFRKYKQVDRLPEDLQAYLDMMQV